MNNDQIKRRNRLDLNTPAELSIYNSMQDVEKMSADVKLTEAVNLLAKARSLVADFVDENNIEIIPQVDELTRIKTGIKNLMDGYGDDKTASLSELRAELGTILNIMNI